MKKTDFIQRYNQPNISRRNFVRTSAGISLAVASGSFLTITDISKKHSLEEKLTSILNKKSSIVIGQAILETPQQGLQYTNLVSSIMNSLKLSTHSLASISKKELSIRLKEQTTSDFDRGEIINVTGWVIGHTEAQLCLLAAHRNTST